MNITERPGKQGERNGDISWRSLAHELPDLSGVTPDVFGARRMRLLVSRPLDPDDPLDAISFHETIVEFVVMDAAIADGYGFVAQQGGLYFPGRYTKFAYLK